MENHFARRGVMYRNECLRACGELAGIAEGVIADGQLNDAEIGFLNRWLEKNDAASCEWPAETARSWGEPIAMSEEVKRRVDALWKNLGL